MSDQEIIKAEKDLINKDPVLGSLIKLQGHINFQARDDYFASLCRSIVGQQVSLAAAAAIFSRLENITSLKPNKVYELTEAEMKHIGLSRQKYAYIKDLAGHFVKDPAVYNHLNEFSDEEVIGELSQIKGIGTWTAQMFLLFTLGRGDVFAPDDAGLRRAIVNLYKLKKPPTKESLDKLADKWRPYRSVACWHLWHSLHNTPL